MRRPGFICDECDEEEKWLDPAGYVEEDGGKELCEPCFDTWWEENHDQ